MINVWVRRTPHGTLQLLIKHISNVWLYEAKQNETKEIGISADDAAGTAAGVPAGQEETSMFTHSVF